MQVFKTFLKIAKKKFPSVLLYYIIFTVIVIAMSKSEHPTMKLLLLPQRQTFILLTRMTALQATL